MHTYGTTIDVAFDHAVGSGFGLDVANAAVTEPREQLPAEGERRLLVAVLEDAIRTYQKFAFSGTRRGRRLFAEVHTWLTNPDTDAALSFSYVCEVLGIDPDYLRGSLERWRAQYYTGACVSGTACRTYTGSVVHDRNKWTNAVIGSSRNRRRSGASRHAGNGATDRREPQEAAVVTSAA